ncbi:MAG TPA: type III-B CRISPR module-associated Cmr3 family protein [Polyangium sp.]|nr:type III-B CRISPR module-associated Cmr3 family protein [Polyangium sp.]
MSVWLIEPRDPLIVRDGKPIGNDARIETLPFPFPSTTAGAARTRMGSTRGEFTLQGDGALNQLLGIAVAGPVLAEVDPAEGKPLGFFFPAPRDAMVIAERNKKQEVERLVARRLLPKPMPNGAQMDSLGAKELLPIGAEGGEKTEKPYEDAPAYWTEAAMLQWLDKHDSLDVCFVPADLGMPQLPTETRVHVVVTPGERVGIDGGLFQTKGLRFAQEKRIPNERPKLQETRQFAVSIRTEGGKVDGKPLNLQNELAPIGGERRLARWQKSDRDWPECPASIVDAVKKTMTARILLVTPAMFADGALPRWNRSPCPADKNVKVTIAAACVGRPVVVSGWDVAKNQPKATRRLAPAGSVYFVNLEGTPEAVEAWVHNVWLACVSDDPRDCLDGFGLAMVGVWEENQ